MRTILAIFLLAAAAAANAAGDVYAVMSLVGDGLLVVRQRPTTGTSLVGNVREFLPVKDPVFDEAALLAADDAVRRVDPQAHTVLLGGRDPSLLDAQSRSLEDGSPTHSLARLLRSRLPATGATRLILIEKCRHPAVIDVGAAHVGNGSLEGLGYYIDPTARPDGRDATTDAEAGFIAPFAYFTVALVDLATGKVLAERPVYASAAVSQRFSDTLSPWDALTPEQKITYVRDLLKREVGEAVPAVLAAH